MVNAQLPAGSSENGTSVAFPRSVGRRGTIRSMSERTTDLFLALTPDRVLDAVEKMGQACTGLCYALNSFENRVYEVELEGGDRVVAKFYRPGRWTRAQVLEEHRWLAELHQTEVPVVPMMVFPSGQTLERIDGIDFALSERRGGRAPDELGDELAQRLGMLIGRIHTVAVARSSDQVDRPRLDAERYVRRALRFLASGRVIPGGLAERYTVAAEAVAAAADGAMAGVALQRIHADLHLGNILLRDGALTVLDFDDMAIGPAVQDLWLAVPGRDEVSRQRLATMIEGYERFRPFDRSTLALIEPLRGLRMVRYAGWLARRYHDPAFQAGWPDFGTESYWRQEVDDLEEQLAAIRRPSSFEAYAQTPGASDGAVEDATEWTNSDYFWDLDD